MNKRKPIRQGDVLLIPISRIPKNTKPVAREDGRLILAHGEITGHAHAILDERAELVTSDQAAELEAMFLLVHGEESVSLVHEEHGTIEIPADGPYEVRRLREYAPERSRQVQD
jgi:hypothetical protein